MSVRSSYAICLWLRTRTSVLRTVQSRPVKRMTECFPAPKFLWLLSINSHSKDLSKCIKETTSCFSICGFFFVGSFRYDSEGYWASLLCSGSFGYDRDEQGPWHSQVLQVVSRCCCLLPLVGTKWQLIQLSQDSLRSPAQLSLVWDLSD